MVDRSRDLHEGKSMADLMLVIVGLGVNERVHRDGLRRGCGRLGCHWRVRVADGKGQVRGIDSAQHDGKIDAP
jgi:hypothetical protein